MDKYSFQNCQKIVVFSSDNSQVLLAKRKGERDFNGDWSFIGGKMETTDVDLIAGMRREKNEEIGSQVVLKLHPVYNTTNYFVKKDGSFMVLPHYYAQYISGEIKINDEYSEWRWVSIAELPNLKPMIPNIPTMVDRLQKIAKILDESEFVQI